MDAVTPEAKPAGSRALLRWVLRLLGLGLVVLVIVLKVRWHDELVLTDGTVRTGVVTATDNGFQIDGDGRTEQISSDQVRHTEREGHRVPAVTYGFPTLARRLTDQIPSVIGLMLLLAALVVMTGWRWHLLVRGVDLQLPLTSAIRLTFVGAFFNQAVPGSTGGDVFKAYYAAKATNGPTRAVVSVFVDRFIGLFGLVVLAAIVLFLPPHLEGQAVPRNIVTIVLLCVAGAAVVFGVRPIRRALGVSRILRALPFQPIIEEAQTAIRLYRGRPGPVLLALGLSLFNHAGIATLVWGLGRALGLEALDLGTCLALVPVCNLMSAIPLLPGGWGVGEWAFAYFFGQVGIPATEAVGLSVIYRLSMLAVSLPGGLLWIAWRDTENTDNMRQVVDDAVPALPQEDS